MGRFTSIFGPAAVHEGVRAETNVSFHAAGEYRRPPGFHQRSARRPRPRASLALGNRFLFAHESGQNAPAAENAPARNRKRTSTTPSRSPGRNIRSPGLFPGQVVEVHDPKAMPGDKPDAAVIKGMFEKGIAELTGKNLKESFGLFFTKDDIVGLKVNPVGPGLISTRLEVVDAVVAWLEAGGLPGKTSSSGTGSTTC